MSIAYCVFFYSRGLVTWFVSLPDKFLTNPKLSLINVPALNYLLRSEIFVNEDGQLRAVHLILDFEPISRSFLDVGNSIRAGDYRLARIDVSRPNFLANHDLPPVDHPIPQGIPLAVEPLREVAFGGAVLREVTASSSSLELEIDEFRFEEERVHISEAAEGEDEQSSVHLPDRVITYIVDSTDEEEDMAPRTDPSLKELMKGRNKGPPPQDKGKSIRIGHPPPPPPQVPTDLGLKPNPDLRRKRPVEPAEEGELGPSKGNKQARPAPERRSRRSNSVESHEERPAAPARKQPQTWSPELEVDGGPIRMDASLRHFRGGHAGRLADALLQPLLLPSDMKAYRSFDYPDLLHSMKRDLAMVSYLIKKILVCALFLRSKAYLPFT